MGKFRALGRRLRLILLEKNAQDFINDGGFSEFYYNAVHYINAEFIEGDILEFGVYGGKSLSILAKAERIGMLRHRNPVRRRVIGFDSFLGLPEEREGHGFWKKGSFAVSPKMVVKRFKKEGLDEPILEIGLFEDTLPKVLGSKYSKAALIHVDCDIYESTITVLDAVEPILQDGTIIAFDDWFLYKANPNKGENRAFQEFIKKYPHWQPIHWKSYGLGGNSFIMHRK